MNSGHNAAAEINQTALIIIQRIWNSHFGDYSD